jgi:hypothetical protein
MKAFIIIAIVLSANSCELFEVNERLLAEHQKNNGEKVRIYYVSLGATTNDVIKVRKSNQDSSIWALDKYNYLKSSKLINDTLLQMVLSDTGFNNNNNKLDTVIVKVQ